VIHIAPYENDPRCQHKKTAAEAKVVIGPLRCGQKGPKLYPQRQNHITPFHTQHRCGSCQADAMIPLCGA
jgi:hypothetical protein